MAETLRAFIPHVGWLAHADGDEVIRLLRQGYFEAEEQAFVWRYLLPGDWFFDCGAHVGLYSVSASRVTGGDVRVLAVEPDEEIAGLLEGNLARNGVSNARVIRGAVWKAPGTVRFQREPAARSAYSRVQPDAQAPGTIEVPAVTVDQLVDLSGASQVALVKLDVEGAEPEALEGAASTIARHVCGAWMIEFTEENLARRGWSTARLEALVKAQGLTLCEISPETHELVPFSASGPVWFRNLFATPDPERVNARLRSASPERVEIARDILERARACSRFKELEELELAKSLAASHERWAKNVEALLASEKELVSQLTLGAEAAERRAEAAEQRLRRLDRWLRPWRALGRARRVNR
jgi:FkbM family methyltransferase